MKFPLINLYNLNRCKPIVQVKGIEGLLQWDYCDLEGLPPERVGSRDGMPTMTDMGNMKIYQKLFLLLMVGNILLKIL
jgi:hypothetical protein